VHISADFFPKTYLPNCIAIQLVQHCATISATGELVKFMS